MGNIKQTFIKRAGKDLIEKYPTKFKPDFEQIKKTLQELMDSRELNCPSKKVRNRLAGFMVRATGKETI
ncbi:MAG: 30S ribosomal protein S17e [archaeon]